MEEMFITFNNNKINQDINQVVLFEIKFQFLNSDEVYFIYKMIFSIQE
jgi:hypothetical protein